MGKKIWIIAAQFIGLMANSHTAGLTANKKQSSTQNVTQRRRCHIDGVNIVSCLGENLIPLQTESITGKLLYRSVLQYCIWPHTALKQTTGKFEGTADYIQPFTVVIYADMALLCHL